MKRNISISLILILFLINSFPQSTFSQDRNIRVTGRVTDSKGELMIGVAITEVGVKPLNAVTTNIDGNYTIQVSSTSSILKFSFIGYEEQEIRVGTNSVIDVLMQESTSELDEVVVVGFGEQKKTDVIGSVTTIRPQELQIPSSNLTMAFAGQAAGVISYQRTGEPGENADFFIRGVTSFGTGKVDPLILIDGMELSVTELARLKPDDIESFSIFKDATSTAVYGARGANGVIYVTTKGGKQGKAKVDFRAETSFSSPTQNVEFADPITYMTLYNEALAARNPLANPEYSREQIDLRKDGVNPIAFPTIDWKDELFKKQSFNHRYNISVSGGGKVASYYVSGSFSQDNGMLKVDKLNNFNNNINLKSYTLRSNVNINLTKTSEMIVRLSGNFDDYTGPIQSGNNIYKQVVHANPVDLVPYYPVDEEHKYITHTMFGGVREKNYINPYANMVSGYKEYNRSLMMAQLEFKQDLNFIAEGLKFRTMFNTNRISRFDIERSFNPFYYAIDTYDKRTDTYIINSINPDLGTEYLSYRLNENAREQSSVFYLESALNYNRIFNEKHSLGAMIVYLMRNTTDAKAENLQLSLPYRNLGVSGRATYGYDERYFLELNFGYNGSERFDKQHRFGFFPSAGVAWTISNEPFWMSLKRTINLFKIRATYGLVGNDAIGARNDRFFYLSNVDMNDSDKSFVFGRELNWRKNGITVTRYANPNISWEISQKGNIAVEIGLFKKATIIADFFKEYRSNILMNRIDIPSSMGLTAPVRANVGAASSKGMDISLDFKHSFNKNTWLTVRSNFTYATNKYEIYEEPLYDKEYWKSRVGKPLSCIS